MSVSRAFLVVLKYVLMISVCAYLLVRVPTSPDACNKDTCVSVSSVFLRLLMLVTKIPVYLYLVCF